MIITLCGSGRFEPLYHAWMEVLTLSGHSVFGLGCYPSWHAGEKDWFTDEQKAVLDQVHKRKIAASDAVLVLNRHGYVGESTLSEIAHARATDTEVYTLESWGKGIVTVGSNTALRHAVDAGKWGVRSGFESPFRAVHDGRLCRSPWDLLMSASPEREWCVHRTHIAGWHPDTVDEYGHGSTIDRC